MKDWSGQWWPTRYSWRDRVRFRAEHSSGAVRLLLNVSVSVAVCVGIVLLVAGWVHALQWLLDNTPALVTIPAAFGIIFGVGYWWDSRSAS